MGFFGQVANNPFLLLVLVLIIVVVFGSKRLPGAAKSLGQSLNIFKNEMQSAKKEATTAAKEPEALEGEVQPKSSFKLAGEEKPSDNK